MTAPRGASDLSTSELIRDGVAFGLASTFVAFPATIVEIQAGARKRVAVQPATDAVFRGPDGRPTFQRLPVIYGVPVQFPRTPRSGFMFPVEVGDPVLIVVTDRPIGEWLRKATETPVADVGNHCLDGAVAIPGLLPDNSEPIEFDHPVIGYFGALACAVHINESEVRIGANVDTQPIALAPLLEAVIDALANTAPVSNDGGAAIQAAVKAIWDGGGATVSATRARAI